MGGLCSCLVQALTNEDKVMQRTFCELMLEIVEDNETLLSIFWWLSDFPLEWQSQPSLWAHLGSIISHMKQLGMKEIPIR